MDNPIKKYYVVWAGFEPGVYDTWEDCQLMTEGYSGARFKAFPTKEAAVNAYRAGADDGGLELLKAIAKRPAVSVNFEAFPEIDRNGIAVDAACAGNPGPVEYRGVSLATGKEIFHMGPLEGGTNNIGEFLAIVHALALLDKQGVKGATIYSDSKTAQSWLRNRHARTSIQPTEANAYLRQLLARAQAYITTHPIHNFVRKWDTETWGEIPADFGRK